MLGWTDPLMIRAVASQSENMTKLEMVIDKR